jgi:hypothetical protein
MRRRYPIPLLAGLACLLVFANGARAGVTIDVVFQDATVPSGLAILPGDAGPDGERVRRRTGATHPSPG